MILVAGASFTAEVSNKWMPKWHDYLVGPRHRKVNLASGGAGNMYIGKSVEKMLGNKIRACLIMWSHMYMLDVASDRPRTKYHTAVGGKIWNHYGHMASGKGKSDWKRLGYDKVIEMNIDAIQSTHKALDQLGIPYVYTFGHGDEHHTEDMTKNAIKPYLADWARKQGMLAEDNYHANAEAHKQWSDLVRPQINFTETIS